MAQLSTSQGRLPIRDQEKLTTQLASFAPIELAEMQGIALLDRVEAKYAMHIEALTQVFADLDRSYQVLEVAGQRLNRYRTLYFDTKDFELYLRHHGGVQNRYKVRAREYVESDCSFLEVKHRTNKKRVVKSRLPTPELMTELPQETAGFLRDHCPYQVAELFPTLWTNYERITLVSQDANERLTLDVNISFRWQELVAYLPGIVIAEVKRKHHIRGSAFIPYMRELHIRRTRFSKYCIGVSLLYPDLKRNRFKSIHRRLAGLAQGGKHVNV